MGTAVIDTKTCLAWQGTLCRSCFDDCPIFDEAIKMDDKLQPVVDRKKCVGCGICENVCPLETKAGITVFAVKNRTPISGQPAKQESKILNPYP